MRRLGLVFIISSLIKVIPGQSQDNMALETSIEFHKEDSCVNYCKRVDIVFKNDSDEKLYIPFSLPIYDNLNYRIIEEKDTFKFSGYANVYNYIAEYPMEEELSKEYIDNFWGYKTVFMDPKIRQRNIEIRDSLKRIYPFPEWVHKSPKKTNAIDTLLFDFFNPAEEELFNNVTSSIKDRERIDDFYMYLHDFVYLMPGEEFIFKFYIDHIEGENIGIQFIFNIMEAQKYLDGAFGRYGIKLPDEIGEFKQYKKNLISNIITISSE